LSLIAEQLKEPAFKAEDFETVKKRTIGDLEQSKQSTGTQGAIAFRQCVYPNDHPNYIKNTEEEIALVNSTTIEDVRKFHASSYGVGNMIVVTVGDVDDAVIKSSLIGILK
jgi:zinc protease